MRKAIIVTGTPATGKTTVAKAIAAKIKAKYIDVTAVVKRYNLSEDYDKERKCEIVDTAKLNKVLKQMLEKSDKILIIDSHMSHDLPKSHVKLCIVTKCQLRELKKRLETRGYSKEKVRENLDSEIFDICFNEAKEKGHDTRIIDTSQGRDDLAKFIDKINQ
ncbi:MAG: AAA family ATPase [Nanoarchaeota archaeon]|nr:AAA family ATPase [Nanoarchaeota archaeon]